MSCFLLVVSIAFGDIVSSATNLADRPSRWVRRTCHKKKCSGRAQPGTEIFRELEKSHCRTIYTRKRYDLALDLFFHWLPEESLSLPRQKGQLDSLVSDDLEKLW